MSDWRDQPSAASSRSPTRPGRAGSRRDGKASKREQVAAACFECRSKKVKVNEAPTHQPTHQLTISSAMPRGPPVLAARHDLSSVSTM
ncbi:uncharacterized protein RCC_10034 [Ramularia collo-cygni]|uniref:Uncharacterized protein n=1 Tax=Ramularia collo-cygni TaxID=112498 RepID=A0A2D3VIZ5_9PEZI|nr:uncharacterized protein RCC_10034 [Ramularia collo-cygni]CZT24311.1 uncharacterized protein RCC_10034 [Ramularia collo-cygni]